MPATCMLVSKSERKSADVGGVSDKTRGFSIIASRSEATGMQWKTNRNETAG
jgi:hypothetical protein